MALTIAELNGYIDLDDRGFGRGLSSAEGDFDRFGRQLEQGLDGSENDFRQWAGQIQNLTSEAFNEVADDARDAGEEAGRDLQRGLERGLDGTKDTARRSGDDSGRGFGDGTERGARGRLGGVGGKLAGLLSKGGPWMAAGAAIGGTLMVGLQGAMEKQDAVAKLKAQLGAFGPEGERLGRVTGELFAGAYGESMGEVADAVGAVVSSIDGMRGASDTALQSMTAKAMNLAAAFDVEVARSVQVLGQLVKGKFVRDATQGMDLLTASMQKVPAAVREDLVDALDEYSPFMTQIGITGQKGFSLLVAAAEKGAFGIDKTGDALKEFTLLATDMSASTKTAYDAIGLSQLKMTRDLLAGGERGAGAFAKIVAGLRNIKDPAAQSQAALALFGTPLEDLSTKDIPKFLASLDTTGRTLGDTAGAAQKMGDTLGDTASAKITSFTRTLKKELVDFLGGNVLPSLEEFGGKASAAITGWLAENPEVADKFQALWKKIGTTVGEVVADVRTWLDENKDDIEEWSNKIADAAENAAEMLSAALDLIAAIWERFGPRTMAVLTIFATTFWGYWSGLFKMLTGLFDIFAALLTGDWSRLWSGLKTLVAGAAQMIWAVISGVLRLIGMQWGQAWEKIKQIASAIWAWITSYIAAAVGRLLSAIGLLASLPGKVGAWFGAMKDRAVARASSLVTWMRGLPGRIRSAIGSLGGLLAGAGRNIVTGLWNGISGMTSWLYGKIMGWVRSAVPGPVLRFLGIASPSKLFAKYGRYVAQGLAQGILGGTGLVSSAAGTLAAATMAGGVPITPGGSAAAGTGAAGQGTLGRILIDLVGGEGQFLRWMRSIVLAEGGGDVQLAFGKRR